MRRIRFRLCSACMAVILLLSLLLPSAAQAAGGSGSLADAAVSIAPCAYNGSPQRPKAEVVLNGVNLTEGVDYTISYQNNTNAGEATAVLTAAEGRYTGSIAEKFEIRKRSLRPQDFTVKDGCTKPFDGTTRAEPDVQVSALAGDQVDVTWGRAVYDTKFVGTGKTVTVYGLSLSGPDGNNYELADPAMTLTSAAGQITPVPLKIQPAAQLAAGGASLI